MKPMKLRRYLAFQIVWQPCDSEKEQRHRRSKYGLQERNY